MKDYHIHSIYSEDGEYTPEELVRLCVENDISAMSITDHNTVKGVAEGLIAAERAEIRLIPGIEIDCIFGPFELHILGYGIDTGRHEYLDIENNIHEQIQEVSRKRLKLVQAEGFRICEEELAAAPQNPHWPGNWTGELFAEVLLNKQEEAENPLLLPYRAGGSRSDNPYVNFYWDFCGPGKSCFVPIRYPDASEMIELIHRTGGEAVLAHPGQTLTKHVEWLPEIISMGLDGIEAYSSYHTPDQCRYYHQAAEKAGLCITCGSDYHGKNKPAIRPGGHGLADDSFVSL